MASASTMKPTLLLLTSLKRSRRIWTAGRRVAKALAARLAWMRYILAMRSWKMLLASSTALCPEVSRRTEARTGSRNIPEEDEHGFDIVGVVLCSGQG